MTRLLGSVLVAGAAAYLGFRAAARLKGQIRAMDELIAGLSLLEQELELSAPEQERLMMGLSKRTRGAARQLFSGYAQSLGQLGTTAAELWERAVFELEELSPEGKQCLSSLGEILGRYDCREQRVAVTAVRRRMEYIREEMGRQCQMRCRACQTIGLSGGAFLVILLL